MGDSNVYRNIKTFRTNKWSLNLDQNYMDYSTKENEKTLSANFTPSCSGDCSVISETEAEEAKLFSEMDSIIQSIDEISLEPNPDKVGLNINRSEERTTFDDQKKPETQMCDHSSHANRMNSEYISNCTDIRELSCIELILRQREAKTLPHLIKLTEKRIATLKNNEDREYFDQETLRKKLADCWMNKNEANIAQFRKGKESGKKYCLQSYDEHDELADMIKARYPEDMKSKIREIMARSKKAQIVKNQKEISSNVEEN